MTGIAIFAVVIGLIYVFSQFGGRIAAGEALAWWLVTLFLMIAALRPDFYRSVADLLGIKFISNFVLAGMIMFLFVHALESSASTSELRRKVRMLVCQSAASRFHSNIAGADASVVRVLVVLPCYNEEMAIPSVLSRLRELPAMDDSMAIDFCFVNDGSTDLTNSVLVKEVPSHHVSHDVNCGVSGALLTGFLIARRLGYQWVVQCDSDGQHPIPGIPGLVQHASRSGADLVIGSRFLPDPSQSRSDRLHSTSGMRRFGSVLIAITLRVLGVSRIRVTDPTSGFRVFSERAVSLLIRQMPDEYPEPESIAIIAATGMKIEEVSVTMEPRLVGLSSLAGTRSLRYMIKVTSALIGLRLRRFGPKNS